MDVPAVRVTSCGLADYPRGTSLGPRQLVDYEFVWIERGDCLWACGDRRLECPPGTVILCQPGMRDRFTWDPGHTTRHGYIHFEFLDEPDLFLPMFRRCEGGDVLRPLLRHAVWLHSQDHEWTTALAEDAVRQALHWYVQGFHAPGPARPVDEQHPVLSRAVHVLRARWHEGPKAPLSVAEWADACSVSRGHLARVCREQLDVTPQALLRYLRLEHGLLMLVRSDLKVQAIASLCGFASPYHFSRCCKQAYGHSPRALRERAAAGRGRPAGPAPGIRRIYQQQINLAGRAPTG